MHYSLTQAVRMAHFCRYATCVHKYGIMMSSKAALSLHYHMQHARLQPNLTCKDQSAPGISSTFLSLHKNIISHLNRFFHIPLANYEPCNCLTVEAYTAINEV